MGRVLGIPGPEFVGRERELVVKDVHWADDVTLEFLLFLAAPQPHGPSLLVTYRPGEVPPGSLLLRLSSRLRAGVTQVRLILEGLDIDATASRRRSTVRLVTPASSAIRVTGTGSEVSSVASHHSHRSPKSGHPIAGTGPGA